MNARLLYRDKSTGELADRCLEVWLWLAAGYVVAYSFAGLVL